MVRAAGRPVLRTFVDLALGASCLPGAITAFQELFVSVPRVHAARWPEPWSAPKAAAVTMLLGGAVGMLASAWAAACRGAGTRRRARLAAVGALGVIVASWLYWTWDFLSTAGRFG